MRKHKQPTKFIYAMFFISISLLNSCGFTVDSAITKCKSKAHEFAYKTVPSDEFQKKWMDDQWHVSFYRCMNDSGYAENKAVTDHLADNLRHAHPNYSTEKFLAELNERIRLQRLNADSGYWIRN
jgi:hypothetical protein